MKTAGGIYGRIWHIKADAAFKMFVSYYEHEF